MKLIELLAPAGSIESLKAAVHAGADAVYLGGQKFGARKSASNFDNEGLAQAVKYAHQRGVAVYVTVNTLIKEEEFKEAIGFIDFLYSIDVDALIFQDLGLLLATRKRYPDLESHVSTQMTFHNTDDVLWAKSIGASRVVLGRELSIDEAIQIQNDSHMPIEVFVHGALCIAYSGNCLMSSMIGGRSGNRGSCAQPCRKTYELVEKGSLKKIDSNEGGYLMSPKDTKGIEYLNELSRISPVSLKIEGRMKGPEYVYSVIKAYRDALDQSNDHRDYDALRKVFNRDYGTGYLIEKNYDQLMNLALPSHYGFPIGKILDFNDGKLEFEVLETLNKGDEVQFRFKNKTVGARADQIYTKNGKVDSAQKGDIVQIPFKHKVPINGILYKTFDKFFMDQSSVISQEEVVKHELQMYFKAKFGEKAVLLIASKEHQVKVLSKLTVEKAIKVPMTRERLIDQLSKLGGTPFGANSIEIELDLDVALPISEINRMRRDAVEQLLKSHEVWNHRDTILINPWESLKKEQGQDDLIFYYYFNTLDAIKSYLPLLPSNQVVLKNIDEYIDNESFCLENGIIPYVPKILRNHEIGRIRSWFKSYQNKGEVICLTHFGQLTWLEKENGIKWIAEEELQTFNRKAYSYYKSLGAIQVMASSELSDGEIREVSPNCGVFLYGKIPLMKSEYCPVGKVIANRHDCGACASKDYLLKDDKGAYFPLILDSKQCRATVLSSQTVYHLDQLENLIQKGFKTFKLDFTACDEKEMNKIIMALLHSNHKKTFFPAYDSRLHFRGRLKQGVE